MTKNSDGSFALGFNSGEVWSFSATGQLTSRSREGQQVTLDYDRQDLLVRATHQPSGRYLAFSYDANRGLHRCKPATVVPSRSATALAT